MSRRIYAKKSLSQNFLIDTKIKSKIIECLDLNQNDIVVEIGPGRGALTERIYNNVNKFFGIELDDDLYSYLQLKYQNENIEIINDDARKIDISDFIKNDIEYKLVGNLPYKSANKIILNFLNSLPKPKFMIVMVQLEVAKRIIGDEKFRGFLTVLIGIYCKSEILFKVKPTSFKPKPKVNSAVIKLVPYDTPKVDDENIEGFMDFVAKSFVSRRKTVLNSIAAGNKISKDIVTQLLNSLQINKEFRPQNLELDQWLELYYLYKNRYE
jgi:16S rRNA (adenine1518-N6/adenine1519-N6)-dimethyltransferase